MEHIRDNQASKQTIILTFLFLLFKLFTDSLVMLIRWLHIVLYHSAAYEMLHKQFFKSFSVTMKGAVGTPVCEGNDLPHYTSA